MTFQQTLCNGAAGIFSACFAVITTFQEQLEWWIRISGGILGLVIAVITLVRLLIHKTKCE